MSSIVSVVTDSPRQLRKKMGKDSYNLTSVADDDPFAKGITFHVTYLGSGYHATGIGDGCTSEVVAEVWRKSQESRNAGRKMSMVITDKSLKLKDLSTKTLVDDIPLYRVSYCGTDRAHRVAFAFVAKEADTGKMKVHVTKVDNEKKVQAMCATVSKAFSIAFKSWQYKNRKTAKDNSPHTSPKTTRRDVADVPAKASPTLTAKMAELKPPSAVPASVIPVLAPPPASPSQLRIQKVLTKPPAFSNTKVVHSDSPLVVRAVTRSETRDQGNEFEDEFSALARARSHPDLLDTNADDNVFDFNVVRQQADPGSQENLLDL